MLDGLNIRTVSLDTEHLSRSSTDTWSREPSTRLSHAELYLQDSLEPITFGKPMIIGWAVGTAYYAILNVRTHLSFQ